MTELPSYEVPPFDGISANEYIVDVVHDAVELFILQRSIRRAPGSSSAPVSHALNCGFRTRISGETDFPCIYGERVGLGRVYVRLNDGQLDSDAPGVKESKWASRMSVMATAI